MVILFISKRCLHLCVNSLIKDFPDGNYFNVIDGARLVIFLKYVVFDRNVVIAGRFSFCDGEATTEAGARTKGKASLLPENVKINSIVVLDFK